ncbi:metallophosphoesterase family protein [Actinorugispora endophytica]|uniref:DNA repair exonuclease SbcCD nuclease subunit n=1 Tax=Actinorugispora endophytica TaxID=1605990 RepID=A0A4R6V4F5_9ACTN|nr:DNA repair exonuclease [Actinorugispora endophytica]TDQ53109.1 DNA repair exonuclease SbcCD nuclease subunit [Actinorugispora endophytica]
MKLLHAADLHIDSPMHGLARYEGAPVEQMRGATRRAVENLVELALRERVAAVLLAGDVYDGTWRDFNTGLFFTNQMARLREADIPVFMISGNHDAENKMTRELSLPDNVHRFASGEAETVERDDLGLAVHGQSFAQRDVTDNLAERYPAARDDLFNVGLLHTALTGSPGHDNYAPCTVNQLAAHGYQYWALGHIHKRSVQHADGTHVVFPGNTQGRHAGETGAKGCTLVTVDGLSVVGEPEHHDLDTAARWHEVRVDMTDARDRGDATRLIEERLAAEFGDDPDRAHAVRIVATGESEVHAALVGDRESFTSEVRRLSQEHESLWVEKVRIATTRPGEKADPEHVAGLLESVRAAGDALRADPGEVASIVRGTQLEAKLPTELRGFLGDEGWPDRMAGEAVELLVAALEGPR